MTDQFAYLVCLPPDHAPIVSKYATRADVTATLEANPLPYPAKVVGSPDELAVLGAADLVALYNLLTPKEQVKRFADRAAAHRRVWSLLETLTLTAKTAKPANRFRVPTDPATGATFATAPGADAPRTSFPATGTSTRGAVDASATTGPAAPGATTEDDMATKAKAAAKKTKDPKPETAAVKKTKDPKPATAARGSLTFDNEHVITLIKKENPRRPGSETFRRYALYKDGMTVEKYLAAGGIPGDLRWDSERGHIKIGAKK